MSLYHRCIQQRAKHQRDAAQRRADAALARRKGMLLLALHLDRLAARCDDRAAEEAERIAHMDRFGHEQYLAFMAGEGDGSAYVQAGLEAA